MLWLSLSRMKSSGHTALTRLCDESNGADDGQESCRKGKKEGDEAGNCSEDMARATLRCLAANEQLGGGGEKVSQLTGCADRQREREEEEEEVRLKRTWQWRMTVFVTMV